VRKYFSVRVTDKWNSLPKELLQFTTKEKFKIKLDFFSEKIGI